MALNIEAESPHNTFDVRIVPEVEWRLDRSLRSPDPACRRNWLMYAKWTNWLTVVDSLDYPGSRLWSMYLADPWLYTADSSKCWLFKSQTSHLILRRLRSLGVFAELLPCTTKIADLTWKPKGIVFSGGMEWFLTWLLSRSNQSTRSCFRLRQWLAP